MEKHYTAMATLAGVPAKDRKLVKAREMFWVMNDMITNPGVLPTASQMAEWSEAVDAYGQ